MNYFHFLAISTNVINLHVCLLVYVHISLGYIRVKSVTEHVWATFRIVLNNFPTLCENLATIRSIRFLLLHNQVIKTSCLKTIAIFLYPMMSGSGIQTIFKGNVCERLYSMSLERIFESETFLFPASRGWFKLGSQRKGWFSQN